MSYQEQLVASNDRGPSTAMAYPDCPKCRGMMKVKQLSPAVSACNVDEMIYGCARCGTELKRDIKRT
jgi:hypothetical protein